MRDGKWVLKIVKVLYPVVRIKELHIKVGFAVCNQEWTEDDQLASDMKMPVRYTPVHIFLAPIAINEYEHFISQNVTCKDGAEFPLRITHLDPDRIDKTWLQSPRGYYLSSDSDASIRNGLQSNNVDDFNPDADLWLIVESDGVRPKSLIYWAFIPNDEIKRQS